jgi:hypothetical protein
MGDQRPLRIAVIAALLTLVATGCGDKTNPRFCVVAEGSGSTRDADIRNAYLTAFGQDVTWFSDQPGDQPMCLILATGDPTLNPIAMQPIHAADPHSPDADGEVDGNVATARAGFAQVLGYASDKQHTPLAEALFALAQRAELKAGDTVAVYSDMRQFSQFVEIPAITRLNNPPAQSAAIDGALDGLAAAHLLPDGENGAPSLQGIRIVAPVPDVSRPSAPEDPRLPQARAAAAHEFWQRWAARVGADLRWAVTADGGRRAGH